MLILLPNATDRFFQKIKTLPKKWSDNNTASIAGLKLVDPAYSDGGHGASPRKPWRVAAVGTNAQSVSYTHLTLPTTPYV